MREILFRGKQKHNGEWVEGFYLVKTDPLLGVKQHFILAQDKRYDGLLNSMFSWYVVDPNTVGQLSDLKDRNGKRVFEGDIIKTHYTNLPKDIYIEEVVFSRGAIRSVQHCRNGFGSAYGLVDCMVPLRVWFEVIGNIHDNPELLKEAKYA